MVAKLLLLVILLVKPSDSCTPCFSVAFYKELDQNYALFARIKAAAGKFVHVILCGINVKIVRMTHSELRNVNFLHRQKILPQKCVIRDKARKSWVIQT